MYGERNELHRARFPAADADGILLRQDAKLPDMQAVYGVQKNALFHQGGKGGNVGQDPAASLDEALLSGPQPGKSPVGLFLDLNPALLLRCEEALGQGRGGEDLAGEAEEIGKQSVKMS